MRLLFPYLTLFGAVPFVFCAACLLLDIDTISVASLPLLVASSKESIVISDILSVYGIVIASFMAGSHWGNHLQIISTQNSLAKNTTVQSLEQSELMSDWASKLPMISNIIALGLWVGFLIQPVKDFYVLLLISFLIMLVVDTSLQRIGVISKTYFKIRCLVTAIVSVSLVIAIISI